MPAVLPQIKTGEVRMIAMFTDKRHELYPEFATASEQGYKVLMSVYYGFIAPSGMPKEMVDVVGAAVKKVLAIDELKKKLIEIGQPPAYLAPPEFDKVWDEQEEAVKPFISLAQQ